MALFEQWAGQKVEMLSELPASGSDRQYYRITGKTTNVLGAINRDVKENRAFIEFSQFFRSKSLKVPEIYAVDGDMDCYILEDLGNTTLFDWLSTARREKEIPAPIIDFYKQSIEQLIQFQLSGQKLDFSLCHPRSKFDKQSMMWDLHYFKYYFLKLAQISFDEQLLEDDFNRLADYLLQTDTSYFLYRDFQSRNIMVVNDQPAFIDYQGGRQGALQYDLASLLYDAKADLPQALREELLNHYILLITQKIKIDELKFRELFKGYVLIRIMQAMGAYGFRGFYEKKEHFLKSIPYALENLKHLLPGSWLRDKFPTLHAALQEIVGNERLLQISAAPVLTVTINSFSYKRGVPIDFNGNGGGFVFDCRAVHNPGRYEAYKTKTGKDPEVIAFFEKEPDMHDFLDGVYNLVDQSVAKYLDRDFKHLMVNFGCTGGQHRSVYCAERLARHLKNKYQISIRLKHVEQEMRG
ncbi:predicted phosphotransferase related to Ser/Thr protein kinases [Geofilum rubicundum JCM 15548]|uniref:Predicted phosphotransferase related to Ser/Thr protein kinases n=1 Tax=Geofilum rubicundum JCM 15548 TaxID=1236989 RepID=A0A0E9M1E1_9BACT|nr:predicted phosphotransferase related to Ser/Thr protein kinases [Geofilum rubicundum JCM 15548]